MRAAAAAAAAPASVLSAAASAGRQRSCSALRFTSSSSVLSSLLQPSPISPEARLLRVSCNATGSTAALLQDAAATGLVTAGAYALVRAFDSLTKRNLIEQSLSRKLVHVLSGLLFMSSWPIFSSSFEARYFAAIVPILNCIRLVIYGLGLVTDEGLIKSVTRGGEPRELLKGPLYYVLVLLFCALFFWRESPIGIVALSMMSGGDGVADIFGRRFGTAKLPYNGQKSWVGSVSMFLFGFLLSIGMLSYFSAFGYVQLDWKQAALKLVVVSLVATVVESLPISDIIDDNISVPMSSMIMSFLVFGN